MAYMTKDGRGPLANKAGEWVTNQSDKLPWRGDTPIRFGRPRSSKTYTTVELEAMKVVGIYLDADAPRRDPGDRNVPTPPELLEPKG